MNRLLGMTSLRFVVCVSHSDRRSLLLRRVTDVEGLIALGDFVDASNLLLTLLLLYVIISAMSDPLIFPELNTWVVEYIRRQDVIVSCDWSSYMFHSYFMCLCQITIIFDILIFDIDASRIPESRNHLQDVCDVLSSCMCFWTNVRFTHVFRRPIIHSRRWVKIEFATVIIPHEYVHMCISSLIWWWLSLDWSASGDFVKSDLFNKRHPHRYLQSMWKMQKESLKDVIDQSSWR